MTARRTAGVRNGIGMRKGKGARNPPRKQNRRGREMRVSHGNAGGRESGRGRVFRQATNVLQDRGVRRQGLVRQGHGLRRRMRRTDGSGFARSGGYGSTRSGRQGAVPQLKLAEAPELSVIIPVANERRTLPAVLRQVAGLEPEMEVILVVNGATDGTLELAEASGARVLNFEERLGHDIGRSIGARAAAGKILLFIDGDFAVPRQRLKAYVRACRNGADLALNAYDGPTGTRNVHEVVLAKHVLNALLSRPELRGASLTAVPHAMTRRALEQIGADALAVPPLAHARALILGLKVRRAARVDVGRRNPLRRSRQGRDPLKRIILGDHLEALEWALAQGDPRLNLTDLQRRRLKGERSDGGEGQDGETGLDGGPSVGGQAIRWDGEGGPALEQRRVGGDR